MPETNLGTKPERSNEELANSVGMKYNEFDKKKPLLLQILEQYKSGVGATGGNANSYSGSKSGSPETGTQGVQFSEEKNSKSIAPLSIGEGILPKDRSPADERKTEAEKHLDKANSLLDELSREEKSGFKAEIGLNSKLQDEKSKKSSDNYDEDFEDDIAEDLPKDDDDLENNL